MNPRRLYRSRDRQLAGVAGGMADYLELDPTIMRILWIVVGIVSGGLALIAYILLALVIPQAPACAPGAPGGWAQAPGSWSQGAAWAPPAAPPAPAGWTTPGSAAPAPGTATRGIGAGAIVGVALIVLGGIALADATLPGWSGAVLLGPAVILALGAALLVASIRRPAAEAPTPAAAPGAPAAAASRPEPAASRPEPAASSPSEGEDTEPATFDAPDPGGASGQAGSTTPA